MPTLDNLIVLAAVFGVAMDDIIVVDGEWLYLLFKLFVLKLENLIKKDNMGDQR